ncbi:MAG: putative RNA binding protein YcfA (HicA-like mRNA interferase family) [Planctomycetota bacterium]
MVQIFEANGWTVIVGGGAHRGGKANRENVRTVPG